VIPAGAVVIVDGTIRETGPFAAIAPKYPDIGVIGDGTQLLMPGLVDAHSHGRGLSPIQKGVRNDFLENALFDWAYMPVLPPELTAAICALRHLRSGCTLLHHNGFDDDGVEGARRAHIAIRTYLSTGIRLAFSPGVRDESKLAMGGEEFIETLPPDLRVGARPFVFFDKEALADSYFRLFDELYDTYNNKDTRILLAPCWAHGASEAFLRRVRAKADKLSHRSCYPAHRSSSTDIPKPDVPSPKAVAGRADTLWRLGMPSECSALNSLKVESYPKRSALLQG